VFVHADASQVIHMTADLRRSKGAVGAKVSVVVRKTAHDIEADSKALARVDTGFMRNSVTTTITGDGRFGAISAEIGPTAEYGIFQELGTSVMAGKPFMGPAFDRRIPGFEAALAKAGDLPL
jgi:HK97 gp10 family phage protein